MKTAQQLQKNIMRRIYYAYAIMLAFHPLAIRGYLLAIGILVLAKLVHVYAVFQSFSHIQIGELAGFVASTVYHSDLPTLVALFFVGMTILSFRFSLPGLPLPSRVV